MLFSSTIFLFLFLPAVFSIYYLLPRGLKNIFLLLFSLFFYCFGEPEYFWVIFATLILNHFAGILIEWASGGWRTSILTLSIFINLALLGYYKYGNFFIENYNCFLSSRGQTLLNVPPIHLPIGISFFTFQAISYVIDIYRRECEAQKNPLSSALYISFFPQLIAGPIVRYIDVAEQLKFRKETMDGVAKGIQRFVVGLGKKVLIADTLGGVADDIFQLPSGQLSAATAWLGTFCYTLQIYFDFSGYSDMAIGLGWMFGFKFLENFRYPYIAESITDFWRRWHISLSSWFRDYLYIPVGGNRKSKIRTFFNLMLVFFLCGLWHGASWNFVVWGLYHGAFLVFEKITGRAVGWLPKMVRHLYTLVVVMVGWVFFRANTLEGALDHIRIMFGFGSGGQPIFSPIGYLTPKILILGIVGVAGATPIMVSCAAYLESRKNFASESLLHLARPIFVFAILSMCGMFLATGTYNAFIYFRF